MFKLPSSKVMLKILQARLQQYVNHELPDVQAGFRRGRGTRDQIANIRQTGEVGWAGIGGESHFRWQIREVGRTQIWITSLNYWDK